VVEAARVGQRTDFDKLTLELETDGSIEPSTALREASEILIKSLAIFSDPDRVEELTAREPVEAEVAIDAPAAPGGDNDILIDELELSVRSFNCLKRAGIETIGELLQKSESELAAIPNFGQKSIDEVIENLGGRGYELRQD
jgi:DNA-directed RNA polymerase subunit alpha